MPRAKAKQKLIDTRNETYRETKPNTCCRCENWMRLSGTCQIDAAYPGERDHIKSVVPWGTCDLFEAKGE